MCFPPRRLLIGLLPALLVAGAAQAGPDHPVITEVYQDAPGNDGPVGRDPANLHQEFIEIYLPTLADLAPGLSKDALNLAFYEIEGDASSLELGQVSYRIDLPTFDLDPSNGLTGLPRPSSGVVVLGWVDYVGNPPTDLAGTPSTRVALVDGGVTSTTDYTFIAINGAQFGGTTNFPVPTAISHIDTPVDAVVGKIEQGSAVYLLMNRDAAGYSARCAFNDPGACNSFPDLPSGSLAVAAMLDGFAGNDDANFEVDLQPYIVPTGDNIDLEFVLPFGGAYSQLVAQVEEQGNGYQRVLADVLKTTEDATAGNENPFIDSITAYRSLSNLGPFYASPGKAPLTTVAAGLSVADSSLQSFQVLTNTFTRVGLVSANVGGNYSMATATTPWPGANVPGEVVFSNDSAVTAPLGSTMIAPPLATDTFTTTTPGSPANVPVQVSAVPADVADPPLSSSNAITLATITPIEPTTGLDAAGLPFQATSFVALEGIPQQAGVANELAATPFGQYAAANLGVRVFDSRGNGATLLDPLTNLSDPVLVDPLIATMPEDTETLIFINPPGAPGTDDLVTTVLNSAEVASGATTYAASFNLGQTLVQAREFPLTEIPTNGGIFQQLGPVYYANADGRVGSPTSAGLSNVFSRRTAELVLVDTNLGPPPIGAIESGEADDFGLIVEVGQTAVGAPVVTGEFVFLSFTGGREGADIDSASVPPHFDLMTLIYVDLDPLHSVLGAETITRLFVVDGSGGSEIDILEVFALPEPHPALAWPAVLATLGLLTRIRARRRGVQS